MRSLVSRATTLALCACSLGLAVTAIACSSDVEEQKTSSTTTSSGAGGQGGDATTATTTASSTTSTTATGSGGAAPTCVDTKGPVLEVSKLLLGDTTPDGISDANAWKQYGFDVDGLVSTKDSTDLCKPIQGAAAGKVYPDGDAGIDNSFGKNVLPIIASLASDPTATINSSITAGEFTLLVELEGLTAAADAPDVTGKLFSGSTMASQPKFDGTDCWPVTAESLTDANDIESATALFPMSTLASNHFESASAGTTVSMTFSLGGLPFTLTIHEARIAMDLDADHQGAQSGQIGGVLDTEELVAALKTAAGSFDPSLCSGSTFENIANQFRQASDILADGTQDPNQDCNGISIGIGFRAKAAKLGGVAAPVQPNDPCAP
jgi:hypothetical protein